MKKNVRRAAGVSSAALAGIVLVGCAAGGDAAPSAPQEEGPVTLSFVGADNPETYAPVIDAFEAENPDITVEYTQIPLDSFSTAMQQRLSSKDDTVDVYTVNQPNIASNAAQGFLVDLSAYSEELEPLVPADQYDVGFYDEKLWALPVWTSTQLLFYNKDLLEQAGVAFPSADPAEAMTWEQVVTLGTQVQQATGAASGLTIEAETYYGLQPLAESLGGGSGVTGSGMLEADIANAGWVKAMEWYQSLYTDGVSERLPSLQGQTYFMDSNAAFYVGGPWDVGIFADSEVEWGVAPFPYFAEGERVTPTGSWSWGISPYSKHQEAAKKFIEFGSLNPEGNRATTEVTTIIPSNLEAMSDFLAELDGRAGERSAGTAAIIADASEETAVARPTTVGYLQFEQIVNKAFSDIANGADVKERLDKAQEELKDAWSAIR
ncbi:extracellular solute-binding protein [Microbacterium esteraromaticum]|uniref:Extracellular solute-binding protein n=1 Tax=Microbacterium esteraromaticum TaxID=57043 RepID=A0A7D7WDQ9_9MICO|nr:sugar ABC transporter substrate-binding protein [Microbacterium esteraromaticum]QMU96271.1 extracellular solute-binding protein [Microbacterium esteraromaticum]